MPVDLSFGNSIINAYMAGASAKRQREQDKHEREKEASDKAEREAARQEAIRQFGERQKQEKELADKRFALESAVADIQKFKARQDFENYFSETGNLGGAKETGEYQVDPNAPDTNARVVLEHPILGKMTPLLPEAASALKARKTSIEQAPALEKQAEFERVRGEREKALKELEIKLQENKDREAYRRAVEVANIKNKGRVLPGDRPVTPEAQRDVFGLSEYDPTLTYNNAAGRPLNVKLNETQIKNLSYFDDLQAQIEDVQKDFEALGDKEHSGYDKYYGGATITGLGRELGQNVKTGEIQARIRRKLSDIQLKAKEAENLGAALSPTEKDILKNAAPTPDRTKSAKAGKEAVEGYLESIKNSRKTYTNHLRGNTLPKIETINSPAPKVIQYDANGKRIGG